MIYTGVMQHPQSFHYTSLLFGELQTKLEIDLWGGQRQIPEEVWGAQGRARESFWLDRQEGQQELVSELVLERWQTGKAVHVSMCVLAMKARAIGIRV